MGLFDKTVDDVPFENRWKCSPHTSGANGGHEINLIDLLKKDSILWLSKRKQR